MKNKDKNKNFAEFEELLGELDSQDAPDIEQQIPSFNKDWLKQEPGVVLPEKDLLPASTFPGIALGLGGVIATGALLAYIFLSPVPENKPAPAPVKVTPPGVAQKNSSKVKPAETKVVTEAYLSRKYRRKIEVIRLKDGKIYRGITVSQKDKILRVRTTRGFIKIQEENIADVRYIRPE